MRHLVRRLAAAASCLALRHPLLIAWTILALVLAGGVVEVKGDPAPAPACRTADDEAARIGAMPGHVLVRIFTTAEVGRLNAWLAAVGSDESDFTLGVQLARADGAAVLALGRSGCVDRWVIVAPSAVPALTDAIEGTVI